MSVNWLISAGTAYGILCRYLPYDDLAAELAKDSGLQINQLPVVGCAPEWMSEKKLYLSVTT